MAEMTCHEHRTISQPKRWKEILFLHSETSHLLPSLLLKVMKLKSMVTAGARNDGQVDSRPGKGSEKMTNTMRMGMFLSLSSSPF
ncbi:unnamed protein product [Calypogeia fissa]